MLTMWKLKAGKGQQQQWEQPQTEAGQTEIEKHQISLQFPLNSWDPHQMKAMKSFPLFYATQLSLWKAMKSSMQQQTKPHH